MIDGLSLKIGNCSENDACVVLTSQQDSAIAEISGFLRGPFCDYSKTLTADFSLRKLPGAQHGANSVEALVMEPCYWTPSLPFIYELHLILKMVDGTTVNSTLLTGIKRFSCQRDNLRLEGKRIVLRGLRCRSLDEQVLQAARAHETALLVHKPVPAMCELASRAGVPLIVDLRESSDPLQTMAGKLDWCPAVCVVLLGVDQLAEIGEEWNTLQHSCVAVTASAHSTATEISKVNYQALALELAPGERPPAWTAKIDKPVIAISSGPEATIPEARKRCDRWQAELAPEFDLAGYLV